MIIDAPKSRDIEALRQLWKASFGDTDAFLDNFFTLGYDQNRCRCVWENHTPVAALYWFDLSFGEDKVAYLYAVATAKARQGQGLCRRLMEDTAGYLKSLGYRGAALVPGNAGLFTLYEKLGYHPFSKKTFWEAAAQEQSLAWQEISFADYAILRKKYLPKNALEEGTQSYLFLSSFAKAYTAENALACVSIEENIARFHEFWGNPAQLGGLAFSLGCHRAEGKLPGSGPNTAMYLPLGEDTALPSYLGFALD